MCGGGEPNTPDGELTTLRIGRRLWVWTLAIPPVVVVAAVVIARGRRTRRSGRDGLFELLNLMREECSSLSGSARHAVISRDSEPDTTTGWNSHSYRTNSIAACIRPRLSQDRRQCHRTTALGFWRPCLASCPSNVQHKCTRTSRGCPCPLSSALQYFITRKSYKSCCAVSRQHLTSTSPLRRKEITSNVRARTSPRTVIFVMIS